MDIFLWESRRGGACSDSGLFREEYREQDGGSKV